MDDFTENDLRDIERDRDQPPDEPHERPEPEDAGDDDLFVDADDPVIP